MTTHAHHDHQSHPGHAGAHADAHGGAHAGAHPDDDACAEILELDALVFADLLTDVVAHVAALAPSPTRTVVDLGAGTGTGTLALARAFPGAQVVAVDSSPVMLGRLRAAADAAGVGDRVRTVEADLDAGWPATGEADLVWASASMHHVADPDRVLRDACAALAPGGVVAVVEMTGTTPALPPSVGRPGLEDRLAAAMTHAGWNQYPDWTPHLERAGFERVDRVEIESSPATGPDADRWVRTTLTRVHDHLVEHLAPEDVAAVATFLDRPGRATSGTDTTRDQNPDHRSPDHEPSARSGRILWTARRPLDPTR
ncbi:class I SAM-dependent methyltransferase [Cellulosimicrobium sp. PMB13]|uniref:class I SAM-dependent methyltransferase n=1 Tax=Cellulosimicrobium sp. PMB13 TaxID=3120158 RepID=UPI003F4B5B4B